jgi:hypothetical protein
VEDVESSCAREFSQSIRKGCRARCCPYAWGPMLCKAQVLLKRCLYVRSKVCVSVLPTTPVSRRHRITTTRQHRTSHDCRRRRCSSGAFFFGLVRIVANQSPAALAGSCLCPAIGRPPNSDISGSFISGLSAGAADGDRNAVTGDPPCCNRRSTMLKSKKKSRLSAGAAERAGDDL